MAKRKKKETYILNTKYTKTAVILTIFSIDYYFEIKKANGIFTKTIKVTKEDYEKYGVGDTIVIEDKKRIYKED